MTEGIELRFHDPGLFDRLRPGGQDVVRRRVSLEREAALEAGRAFDARLPGHRRRPGPAFRAGRAQRPCGAGELAAEGR